MAFGRRSAKEFNGEVLRRHVPIAPVRLALRHQPLTPDISFDPYAHGDPTPTR